MKILVLSFYFRPDLCAGSFRATALVDALRELAPCGSQLDVITTLPNRYHSFAADLAGVPDREEHAGLSIVRIPLRQHQSGFVDQSRAFMTFARRAIQQTDGRDYDVVFATSSRLMTAVLGAWIARRKRASLYLDMRDIFVDTIKHVLPRTAAFVTGPVFARLERWTINRAAKVNLVSAGFAPYFSTRYPRQRFSYFTNGIDEEFLTRESVECARRATSAGNRPLTVLYAGNLGEGQGMHMIVPRLAQRMGSSVRFKIIGDGGRRRALEMALSAMEVTNVELLPPVRRVELLEAYRAADVLFLHLNDYDAFKKVLPSKLFEYAAVGKPVWAGVAGYAAEFVTSEISNSAVFHPCDVDGAVRSFHRLTLRNEPRTEFVAKYARGNISRALAADVLTVARGGR
jgi:glycosyltransferase involved in cell wall biosynthesis